MSELTATSPRRRWAWLKNKSAFAMLLDDTPERLAQAAAEARFNYVQEPRTDVRTGKTRHLCYPVPGSVLREVQDRIKNRVLLKLELADEVRGYRRGSHNIGVAGKISGSQYQGLLDISKFHPSIKECVVATALFKHGLPWPAARYFARLTTFRGRVPQGAPTSSHIANLVLDGIMKRWILPYSADRGVGVMNYGDDVAFVGTNAHAVKACVDHACRAIERLGFAINNDKTTPCRNRGERRRFIGCDTAREKPNYPRDKYRSLRREFRATLGALKVPGARPLTDRAINSIKQRIAYVGRLSAAKARSLQNTFYRICSQTRVLRSQSTGKCG